MAHCNLTAPAKKKLTIPKSVHRNIEVPVPPNCGVVHCATMGQCICRKQQQQTRSTPDIEWSASTKTLDDKYKVPQLNSVMQQMAQMKLLEAKQPPLYKTMGDLTPRSKAAIAPKISQKLNFNADQPVFKNLTPINVNDSILLPKRPTSIRKKYTKSQNKIPVPELADFLDPLPPLTHIIQEPEINLEFSAHKPDYFDSYLRMLD